VRVVSSTPRFLACQLPAKRGRGTYAVGDDVRVAVEAAFGVAVRRLVARQVPDDERLVARAREEHVRAARMSVSRAQSQHNAERTSRAR
jgi:hypothetical protein